MLSLKLYHTLKYIKNFKRIPNFTSPKTITEVIIGNIVNENINKHYELADKIYAKKYVSDLVGAKYVVKTLKTLRYIEDINIADLPDKFVIKTNNSCGTNYFCEDKSRFDKSDCEKTIKKWLSDDYGLRNGEPHYSLIEPRVFIEEYIDFSDLLVDYKYFCFNGEPSFVQVIDREKGVQKFYDMEWNETDFKFKSSRLSDKSFLKPQEFNKMTEIVRKLSEGIDFCRVDMYTSDNTILFGEFTLTPKGGYLAFTPEKYNYIFKQIYDKENNYDI